MCELPQNPDSRTKVWHTLEDRIVYRGMHTIFFLYKKEQNNNNNIIVSSNLSKIILVKYQKWVWVNCP